MVSNHPSSAQIVGTFVSMHGWLWVDKRVKGGSYFFNGDGKLGKGMRVCRHCSLAWYILRHMIVTLSE